MRYKWDMWGNQITEAIKQKSATVTWSPTTYFFPTRRRYSSNTPRAASTRRFPFSSRGYWKVKNFIWYNFKELQKNQTDLEENWSQSVRRNCVIEVGHVEAHSMIDQSPCFRFSWIRWSIRMILVAQILDDCNVLRQEKAVIFQDWDFPLWIQLKSKYLSWPTKTIKLVFKNLCIIWCEMFPLVEINFNKLERNLQML